MNLHGSVEAEFDDGYIHNETHLNDTSPYETGRNVFYDILHRLPEAHHGKMVRFSCFYDNKRYDVDFRGLPENARPIRFKHMERTFANGVWGSPVITRLDFGYQYTDTDGKNQQEVVDL